MVPAGKTIALVGSSGSGKSSVVSLIERFYDPTSAPTPARSIVQQHGKEADKSFGAGVAWQSGARLGQARFFEDLKCRKIAKLHLPKIQSASGTVADMWVKAKELDAMGGYYVELLARGTGKPKKEIERDIQHGKHLRPQGAIDYGIADRIVDVNQDKIFNKKDYEALLAQSRLKQQALRDRAAALRGEQPSPSLNL